MFSFLDNGVKKRLSFSLLLLAGMMFILTGCWDKKEFNQNNVPLPNDMNDFVSIMNKHRNAGVPAFLRFK